MLHIFRDVLHDAGAREAYQLLQKAKEEGRLNFVGNVEAREAVEGAVDVIVSDGYSGSAAAERAVRRICSTFSVMSSTMPERLNSTAWRMAFFMA